MLELPEMELLRRFIAAQAAGRKVETIRVADRYVLNGLSPRTLHARLTGTRLQPAWRRGSVIGIPTDGEWTVLLHLSPGSEVVMGTGPGGREDRLELELDGGAVLRFRGGRQKGSIGIARRREGLPGDVLGPDALSIGAADFDEVSRVRRGQLKNSLVDQSFIAGLGDVLADEILFRARLHPNREWKTLTADERRNLWMAIWKTLRDALQAGADYRRKPNWLAADRRPGRPCPRCGHPVSQIRNRRPTIACLRCQPLRPPKPRAAKASKSKEKSEAEAAAARERAEREREEAERRDAERAEQARREAERQKERLEAEARLQAQREAERQQALRRERERIESMRREIERERQRYRTPILDALGEPPMADKTIEQPAIVVDEPPPVAAPGAPSVRRRHRGGPQSASRSPASRAGAPTTGTSASGTSRSSTARRPRPPATTA